MPPGQENAPALAEVRNQRTGRGVDRVQPVATVEENARVVSVTPPGDAPVLQAGRWRALWSAFVGLGSKVQSSSPVSASSAATRMYMVER